MELQDLKAHLQKMLEQLDEIKFSDVTEPVSINNGDMDFHILTSLELEMFDEEWERTDDPKKCQHVQVGYGSYGTD